MVKPSSALFRDFSKRPHHPIVIHLRRHDRAARQLALLPASLIWTALVFAAAAWSYTRLSDSFVTTLPLWLMFLSACPCAIWLARIVSLLSRQSRAGSLDELSMIPAGRQFVHATACQVALSEDDAAWWLQLLRKTLSAATILCLMMALCIVLAGLDMLDWAELLALLLDILLLAIAIPLEGAQSAAIACLLGVYFGAMRPPGSLDRASAAVSAFVLLQGMTYAAAIFVAALAGSGRLWLVCALFLAARELAVNALWRVTTDSL